MVGIHSPERGISLSLSSGYSNQDDKTELDPDQPALVASVTKLYVSAVILRLLENGELSTNQPIKNLLTRKTRNLFEEDGLLQVIEGKPAEGRTQIAEVVQGFMRDLPDMVVSYDSLVSKPAGTEFHWTLIATNSGPGGKGNKVEVSGNELWQMGDNGRILMSQGHFPSE